MRRCADPVSVQYVWDAIKSSTVQRQTTDVARLVKIIQKYANCSQAQAELYIQQTLEDDLILEVKRIAQKGSNVGTEVESFKINRQEAGDLQTPADDGYDWYCIECHLAGDVITCAGCYHVFHAECSRKASRKIMNFPSLNVPKVTQPSNDSNTQTATKADTDKDPLADGDAEGKENGDTEESKNDKALKDSDKTDNAESVDGKKKPDVESKKDDAPVSVKDYIYDESLCSICNMNKCDPGSGLDIDEFNYLLSFILTRIKSWVPDHLTSNLNGMLKHEWYTPAEMSWRAGQLFYTHMDMAAVELKIRTKDYKNFSQFKADVLTMLHNIDIFHGTESQEHGAAEFMIRDMEYDIAELQNCVDCYRHSNEKINPKWFCLPCRKPHRLVFAKQKGYPYWPAKVIKETDTTFDVRFFGGKYERAILPKNCVKPITTNMSQLQIKKSSGFNKAMEELRLHQRLLENPSEVAAIKLTPKARAKPKPKKAAAPTLKINQNHKPASVANKSNLSTLSNVSLNSSAMLSTNTSMSSTSDDVYEFHDDLAIDINTKDEPRTSKSPVKAGGVKRKVSYHEEVPEKTRKLSLSTPEKTPPKTASPPKSRDTDVINISDIDDDREGFTEFHDPSQNLVSSSTELLREGEEPGMQKLDQQYSDAVEKMRRKLELCKGNTKQLIVTAMDSMQAEIDRIQNEHNETLKRLFESHNAQISETKKKQWCFNCEQDAIYHCCWNTTYCSPTCQQQHWQAEHKQVCRRKDKR